MSHLSRTPGGDVIEKADTEDILFEASLLNFVVLQGLLCIVECCCISPKF